VEQALYVNLNFAKRPDGTQFIAPDREPSLDLATVVNHIAGLQTFPAARIPNVIASVQGSGTGSGQQGTYLPVDLRRAYTSCTSLDGTGQSIGLFEINGAWNPDDLTKFENAAGISNALAPIPLLRDGITTSNIDFSSSGSISAAAETIMDIDLALTFARRAQVYVSIGQNVDSIIQALLDQSPQINQISSSDGFFEANDSKIADQLMTMAARGITFFEDSGDFGAYAPGDPNLSVDLSAVGEPQFTVVGGTTLSLTPTSVSETTWNQGGEASGGGVVTSFPIPSYQTALDMSHNNGSTSNRNVPDVSMIANTNIEIFISCGPSGSCTNPVGPGQSPRTGILDFGGGTSAATPLWASFTALVNQARQAEGLSPLGLGLGTINPTLYAIGKDPAVYATTFNDIADNSNNRLNSSQPLFPAAAGYDLSTGWGSPKCGLMSHLVSNNPTAPLPVAIAAGGFHTCALLEDGTVLCWGDNQVGGLGNGTDVEAHQPVKVSGLSGVTAITAGFFHTCALRQDGTVWCWGENDTGSLGDGTLTNRNVPVQVQNLATAKAISAGDKFTCALVTDGHVWCWGEAFEGQLGDGVQSDHEVSPARVSDPMNVVAITTGDEHGCALLPDGTVQCWGGNAQGELGVGNTTTSFAPFPVQNLTGVKAIAAGGNYTCALKNDGSVDCWGGNGLGVLGVGTTTDQLLPAPVQGMSGAVALTAGGSTCALMGDHSVQCWGNNFDGDVGDGTTTLRTMPVPVQGLSGVAQISAGAGHVCALLSGTGGVECWGDNDNGQIGDGTTTARLVPTPVQF
jgi:alpha-tubulin suppressor-like RCC1 family protein